MSTLNGHKPIDFEKCPGHKEARTSCSEEIESWPEGDPRKAWYELTRFRDEWKNSRAQGQDYLYRLRRMFRSRYWEQVTYDNGRPVFRSFEDFCKRLLVADPVEVLLRFQGLCGGQAPLEMLPNLSHETRVSFLSAQTIEEKELKLASLQEEAGPVGRPPATEQDEGMEPDKYRCNGGKYQDPGAESDARHKLRADLATPGWVRDLATQDLIAESTARYLGSTSVRGSSEYEQQVLAFREAVLENMPDPGSTSKAEITDCRRRLEQVFRAIFPSAPASVAGGSMVIRLNPADATDTAAKLIEKISDLNYLRQLAQQLLAVADGVTPAPTPKAKRDKGNTKGVQPFSDSKALAFASVIEETQLREEGRRAAQAACNTTDSWDGWMAFTSAQIPDSSPIKAGGSFANFTNKWPADHPRVQLQSIAIEDGQALVDAGVTSSRNAVRRVYLMKVVR